MVERSLRQISEYTLDVLLGKTPLAHTHRATNGSRARVTLKLFNATAIALPDFATTLDNHVRMLAALAHPNVAPVGELLREGDHTGLVRPYYEMGSLRTLMEQADSEPEPLDVALALDLLAQAAHGVAVAHAAGVIHANLKPTNLLLTQAQDEDAARFGYRALVSDFSVVPPIDLYNTPDLIAPDSWTYALPPEFVSSNDPLDARADVYALGAILFELLTGRPFLDIRDRDAARNFHINRAPPNPENANLPDFIRPLINRCLARNPEERFASAVELAQALDEQLGRLLASNIDQAATPAPLDDAPLSTPVIRVYHDQTRYVDEDTLLTSDGLHVGDQEDGLRLPGLPDRFLVIDWDGLSASVTVFHERPVVRIGNERLTPHQARRWRWFEYLYCGPYRLRLMKPDGLPEEPPDEPMTSGPIPSELPSEESRTAAPAQHLSITIHPERLMVQPGEKTELTLQIENKSRTQERFRLHVESEHEGIGVRRWIRVPDEEITCQPGGKESVPLPILTPQAPESYAGSYTVRFRLVSLVERDEATRLETFAECVLDVQRYAQSILDVRPK